MDSRVILPVGTVLDGTYRIGPVLGRGGFGITYEADDTSLRSRVAIKEYYPEAFGDRDATYSVHPKSERHRPTFEWGRSSFLREAQTLARFDNPTIVRVARVFEANSTAYMVMRFEQGESFEKWLKGLGRPPAQEELDAIVAPLLDALEIMHAADFLHRDIAPDNIIVRPDGSPVLLDFGASRRSMAQMSRALTGIVKAGYSPHEQYASDSRLQGPWSDLYALGGTLYRAIMGRPPDEAALRVTEDRMIPAASEAKKGRYRPGFLAGIDACLEVKHSDRPQSVADLRPMLLGRASRLVMPALASQLSSQLSAAQGPMPRRWIAVAAVVAVLGGVLGGLQYMRWSAGNQAQRYEAAKSPRNPDRPTTARTGAEAERERETAKAQAIEEKEARQKREPDAAAEETARKDAEARKQATAAPVPPARTQPTAPEPFAIRHFWQSYSNCEPRAVPEVSVTSAPKHGKIEFQTETYMAKKSLSGTCVGTMQRARILYYVPSNSSVTADRVSVAVSFVRGVKNYDCEINVRQRTTECKLL